jgi:hypothetical protein
LRNEEELISNPDSIIANDEIRRVEEESKNKGKIEVPVE